MTTRNRWRELDRLEREINEAFRRRTGSRTEEFPLINVWTNEEGALLASELPGMNSSDFEISVLGDTLTLKGQREEPKVEEGHVFHRRERGSGAFNRTVQLPFRIQSDGVVASYRRGVLEIVAPRAIEDRARAISVTGA